MNKYCEFAGIGLIPWGPLAAGQLARPLSAATTTRENSVKDTSYAMKRSAADEDIINRVERLAKEKGWTMAQVALAWIDEKVTSPIVGFSSAGRLEEAIIPDKKLSVEKIKRLEEPYIPKQILGHQVGMSVFASVHETNGTFVIRTILAEECKKTTCNANNGAGNRVASALGIESAIKAVLPSISCRKGAGLLDHRWQQRADSCSNKEGEVKANSIFELVRTETWGCAAASRSAWAREGRACYRKANRGT